VVQHNQLVLELFAIEEMEEEGVDETKSWTTGQTDKITMAVASFLWLYFKQTR
jgi:hypothetical protein